MSIQLSVDVRNARLNSIETTIGTSAVLKIFTGTIPDDCAEDDSGTLLASLQLPVDWMGAADDGEKDKSGTWEQLSASGTGDAGYFRVYSSDGATCHMQGIITETGDGGDMTLDDVTITAGDTVIVTAFGIADDNA